MFLSAFNFLMVFVVFVVGEAATALNAATTFAFVNACGVVSVVIVVGGDSGVGNNNVATEN